LLKRKEQKQTRVGLSEGVLIERSTPIAAVGAASKNVSAAVRCITTSVGLC
jgi:hypothetical protein